MIEGTEPVVEAEVIENPVIEAELIPAMEESGVELSRAQTYAQMFNPHMRVVHEMAAKAKTLNVENPSFTDSEIAKTLRLKLKKNRGETKLLKDEQKKQFLLNSNLIQAYHNVVISSSELLEAELEKIEKFVELKAQAELDELRQSRAEECHPYSEWVPPGIDFALMDEEQYGQFLGGLKLQHQNAETEKTRLAEEQRIRTEKEERCKMRIDNLLIAGFKFNGIEYHVDDLKLDRIALLEMNDADFTKVLEAGKGAIEVKQAQDAEKAKELEALQKKQADEKAAQELADKQRLEKIAARAELLKRNGYTEETPGVYAKDGYAVNPKMTIGETEEEFQARIEHNDQQIKIQRGKDAELEKQKAAAAKAETEKKELQDRIDKENEQKSYQERTRKEAELKAAQQPDKVKLAGLAKNILEYPMPEVQTPAARQIVANAQALLKKVNAYIVEQYTTKL